MAETHALVSGLLISFAIALGVRLLTDRIELPYTVLLVAVGFVFTLLPSKAYLHFSLEPLFTHDVILFVFLPAIVFQGAAEIDHRRFVRDLPIIGITVLVGLPVAVIAIGWLGSLIFGVPLLLMLLFGAMVYPIDPVAVLSLFEEAGAPERLAVLVEGESLLDDGLAIVLFSALLGLVRRAGPAELSGAGLLSVERLGAILADFLVVAVGGIVVGIGIGFVAYRLQRITEDRLTLYIVTLLTAYGSFYVGEHVLGVSGILATVVTGLLLGTFGSRFALSERNLDFLVEVWEAFVFFLETLLFVAIGIQVSSAQVLRNAPIVLVALLLLIGIRGGVIYGIHALTNRVAERPTPRSYQHVITWGGMHGVIPVALALGLEPSVPARNRLQAIAFGVVIASMVIQGLLMPKVLEVTGVTGACVAEPERTT